MIEMGLIVGLALLFTLAKMSWPWKLRVLSHPLMIDVFVLVGLLALHWGTFSGVMIATIGAFACSVVLSVGRWAVGYMHKGKYIPGRFNITHKIKAA
jgi:hypothetical protein